MWGPITNGIIPKLEKCGTYLKQIINFLLVSTLFKIKYITTAAKTELSLAPNFAVLTICKTQNPIKIDMIS